MTPEERQVNVFDGVGQAYFVNLVKTLMDEVGWFFADLEVNLTGEAELDTLCDLLLHCDSIIMPKLAVAKMLFTNSQGREYGGVYMGDILAAPPDETRDRWQVKEDVARKLMHWHKLYMLLMKKAGNRHYSRLPNGQQASDFANRVTHINHLFWAMAYYFMVFSRDEIKFEIIHGRKPEDYEL